MPALSKESGNDEDMVEMIALEISSLSSELKDIEEKLKVLLVHEHDFCRVRLFWIRTNFY